MKTQQHALISQASGTQRHLVSHHFGTSGARPKVYIQASLHADELPGMLVSHHLYQMLAKAESSGQLKGEVVLVPVANPIGLDQTVMHSQLGRFELATASNFNRGYPLFAQWLCQPGYEVWPHLGNDLKQNQQIVRSAMKQALDRHLPTTELDSLRHTLMRLSLDADVVLDLHCDFEAALHMYTEPPCLDVLLPLAQYMQARAMLVAEGSGGHCFDEVLSGVWWQLQQAHVKQYGEAAHLKPVGQGCASVTVELRGQTEVSHVLAQQDAQAIMNYLIHLGVVDGQAPSCPVLPCDITPLTGTQVLAAPHPGVIVFHVQAGADVKAGDALVDIVEPLTGQVSTLKAEVDGVMYARHIVRWATTGLEVARVSGATPRRSGYLLSA